MEVENLCKAINSDFYTGVPDSNLKALCDFLTYKYGENSKHHIICANEGNSVALGAGYHLATGKVPVIYLQNSGQGNIINPVASLLNDNVYAIPAIFIIGWRGEPGVQDEPQHAYQGKVTLKLLDDMDIKYFVISKDTKEYEIYNKIEEFKAIIKAGKQVAFVVKKGGLTFENKVTYKNNNTISREEAIEHITKVSADDFIISTTGKISRELYEIRDKYNFGHGLDFLTIGSMGHASSIALGVAINKKDKKIWCIDGDGAMLMHMGSMAIIGTNKPDNLIYVVINNSAHETVGGMPTAADKIDIPLLAKALGYPYSVSVDNFEDLDKALLHCKNNNQLSLIEIKCAIGSRKDLGRPKEKPIENKEVFMKNLSKEME